MPSTPPLPQQPGVYFSNIDTEITPSTLSSHIHTLMQAQGPWRSPLLCLLVKCHLRGFTSNSYFIPVAEMEGLVWFFITESLLQGLGRCPPPPTSHSSPQHSSETSRWDVSPVSPNPLPQASLPLARLRAPPGRSPVPAWQGQGTGPGLGTPDRKLAEIRAAIRTGADGFTQEEVDSFNFKHDVTGATLPAPLSHPCMSLPAPPPSPREADTGPDTLTYRGRAC